MLDRKKWTAERANEWYARVGVIKGCNYLPRTAVNMTEMWRAETFDPGTIDEELGWAEKAGYNSVRVFLQYLVWQDDPGGMKKRLGDFLAIADRHGMRAMLILFCDCAFSGKEPYLGKQDEPVPGVHNSQWVPSPGLKRVTDRNAWPDLERYVKDVVGHFGQDHRVLIWDLYNEPGMSDMGENSIPLLEAAFRWARSVGPTQPLTTGPYTFDFTDAVPSTALDLSDVISFHNYLPATELEGYIAICKRYNRPVLCTEWLRRQHDNTFQSMLPIFAKHHIGWYLWGLVAGSTQTYLSWESKPGDPDPEIWQHDFMHPDGTTYEDGEILLIKQFEFGTGHSNTRR